MKHLEKITSLLVMIMLLVPYGLQAQKKDKKEKSKFVWELPELTGNESFDTYLLTCDTLYSRIQAYNDSIVYYKVIQTDSGQKDDTGKPLYEYAIVDDEGNVRNTGRALLQYTDFILTGTNITLDCASLSLHTASATLALPSLGLKALSYGKYVKSGPRIVGMGAQEIKEIVTSCKAQAKAIRALKKSSTNTGDNKDVVMISSQVPEGIEIVQKTKEEMDELVNNAVKEEVGGADQIDDSVFES